MKKKIYDIVEDGSGSCTIYLYGYIGTEEEVRSKDFLRELNDAIAQYDKIAVRVNSMGGEVYEGIAIYNALKSCKADITIYIDGIAASTASFISACGRKVLMGTFSRLMIHEPSGGCYGTKEAMKECITELEAIEGDLIAMYAKKSGKSEEEIKAAYFDGKDHWLTAQEAVAAGLVDGIYDTEEDYADGDKLTRSTARDAYKIFNNRLLNNRQQSQNNNNMVLIDELKTREQFKNCKTDKEVLAIVDSLIVCKAEIEALKKENDKLKSENKQWVDAAEAKIKKSKEQLLDAAMNDGRLNAETRPIYAEMLDKDIELGKRAIAALPKQKKAVDVIENHKTEATGSAWEQRQKQIRDQYNKA